MIRSHPRTQVRNLVALIAVLSWVSLCRSNELSPWRNSFDYPSKKPLIPSHYHFQQRHQEHVHHTTSEGSVTEDIMDSSSGNVERHDFVPLKSTTPRDQPMPTTALNLIGGALVFTSSSFLQNLLNRLKVGAYFGLWYALNIIYNIVNKQVLNVLPAPLIVGTLQLGVGALYVSFLWGVKFRTRPHLTSTGHQTVNHIGLWHSLGQLCTMVSLGAGPVSFTHIVKAMEPFFSALMSAVVSQKWMPWYVYVTLIPVVGGVGYASYKETNFSWLAFGTAMGSNVAFALRAVLSKVAMTHKSSSSGSDTIVLGTDLSPVNVFGLVTWSAFLISIPIAIIGEGPSFLTFWKNALTQSNKFSGWFSPASFELLRGILLSGFFHYMNNEVMYLALDNVHPVTLAVGNTMKRVFIMVAAVMFFQNAITLQSALGSTIGIGGVLLYSLTLHHYTTQQALRIGVKA